MNTSLNRLHSLFYCKFQLALVGLVALWVLGTSQVGAQIAIASIEDLQSIGHDPEYPLDGDYALVNDIDAVNTEHWNGGTGFQPIGDEFAVFSGTFDGQGFLIACLTIDSLDDTVVGLFGAIGPDAVVQNLGLEDVWIRSPGTVGGLVGWNAGRISACYTTGAVSSATGSVGGLVGINSGTVTDCYSAVETYCGYGDVGGLVGLNDSGEVFLSYATGGVYCDYGAIGGLVGWNAGTVSSSSAAGAVGGEGSVGGLLGTNQGTVAECYATGVVTCGYGSAGGLVGWNRIGSVSMSYASGLVSGGYYVAGLVGMNDEGLVSSCYSTGTVLGGIWTGGSVGANSGAVEASMWDIETSMTIMSDGGTGLDTETMQTQSTFTDAGWDLATVWYMQGAASYPYLRNVAFAKGQEHEAWSDGKQPVSCHAGSTEGKTRLGDLITLGVILALLTGAALRSRGPSLRCRSDGNNTMRARSAC